MNEFRETTEEDFSNICKLITNEDELFLVYPKAKYPLTINQLVEVAKKRAELCVLTVDEKVIGFANLYNYEPMKSAFIGNVIIHKDYRNMGFGKKLILHMINLAFGKHNLPEINLSVFNENAFAILLYVELGFTPYDIEEWKNNKDERVALIHMKKLRPENFEIENLESTL